MALQIETIRATADRVAASHHLDVVDVEFTGGAKHRTFVSSSKKTPRPAPDSPPTPPPNQKHLSMTKPTTPRSPRASPSKCSPSSPTRLRRLRHRLRHRARRRRLHPRRRIHPRGQLPGLERKLLKASDYARFRGSLAKVQTFTAVDNNRHFTGRLTGSDDKNITLDLAAVKQKSKSKKQDAQTVEIPLANIEKANLVAEI